MSLSNWPPVVASAMLVASSCTLDGRAQDLVLRDVTVVSPERAAPLEHAYVLVRDGRIAAVSTDPMSADRQIDADGRFLIPGLIDGHVHLGNVAGMQEAHQEAHPAIEAEALAQEPRSYLYFGFTTVVDLAGESGRIARWNRAELRPDAHFCGPAPLANGYPMVFVPEDLRFRVLRYFLYDERQSDRIPDYVDPGEHTPQAVVKRMAADGAICVKTHYETGFGALRGQLPTPTEEMIRALVTAASAEGLPVLLHANSKDAQAFAVETGVHIIAHGLWNGIERSDTQPLPADVEGVLRSIVADGIGYQPTVQVLYGELDAFDTAFLTDPRLADVYPASLLEWYGTAEASWFRDQLAENLRGRDPDAIYDSILESLDAVIRFLAERDARLLFGSDTPSGPTYANPPGLNGYVEMRRWVEAGVSEEQLFRALTIENARAFGLENDLGSVEPGKLAHLLLLDENPLESVGAYDSIDTVILAGRPIERAQLSARNAAAAP